MDISLKLHILILFKSVNNFYKNVLYGMMNSYTLGAKMFRYWVIHNPVLEEWPNGAQLTYRAYMHIYSWQFCFYEIFVLCAIL